MVRAPTGADAHAHAAAHAVQRRHGHGVLVNALALAGLHVHDLGSGGSLGGLLLSQSEGTDGGMGADIGAVVALDALGSVPSGNGRRTRRASHKRQRPARTGRPHDGRKAETGRLSPSMRPTGNMMSSTCFTTPSAAGELGGHGLVLGVSPVGGHVELLVGGSARHRWPCGSCPQRPGPSSGRSGWRRPSCTAGPRSQAGPWPERRRRTAGWCWCACPCRSAWPGRWR